MWIVIGIIALIFIIKFIYDNNQQTESVQKQGGMRNKYSTLINIILSADNRTTIQKITSNSVDLVLSNVGGTTVFFLTQTFGKLTVQWKVQSPIYGSHKLEWEFPEFLDQEKMFERISNDLAQYQKNVLSARSPQKDEFFMNPMVGVEPSQVNINDPNVSDYDKFEAAKKELAFCLSMIDSNKDDEGYSLEKQQRATELYNYLEKQKK